MILLPIVGRELRLATRRRRTYWIRSCAAACAVALGAWMLTAVETWQAGASIGRSLFDILSAFAFVLCLLAGVFTTSTCLYEEKSTGTLGLLFLTDLKGHDVALGKLAAVSLNTAQTLMGIFPVLAVPLVLGGVSLGEFWRMVMTLLNTLFLSLAAGIFISAVSRRQGKAIAGTFSLLVFITAGLGLLDHFLFGEMGFRASDYYLLPGPFQAFGLVADDRFNLALNSFWQATFFTFWLGVSFLALASLILPGTCQSKPYWQPFDNWRERWSRRATGAPADLRMFRRQMLKANPALWLATRHRWRWIYTWAFIGLAIALWLAGLQSLAWSSKLSSLVAFLALPPLLHAILKISIASEASARFAEARSNGELELLLVTPLSVQKICRGHLTAMKRRFTGPLILVLLIDLVMMFYGGKYVQQQFGSDLMLWLLIWATAIMLLIDAHTLAWVGLWQGLNAKSSLSALRNTILRILVLPWLVFLLSLYMSPTFYLYGVVIDSSSGWLLGAVIWWWIVGFMVNTIFQIHSKRDLYENFRSAATQRFVLRRQRSRT